MGKFTVHYNLSTDVTNDDLNEANFVKKLLSDSDTSRLALAVVLQVAIDTELEFAFESDGINYSAECVENLTLFVQQHIDVVEFNETFLATIHTIALMDKKNIDGLLRGYHAFLKSNDDV